MTTATDWTKPAAYRRVRGPEPEANVRPLSKQRKRDSQQLWKELRAKYSKMHGRLFVAKAQIGPGSDPCKVNHLFSACLFLRVPVSPRACFSVASGSTCSRARRAGKPSSTSATARGYVKTPYSRERARRYLGDNRRYHDDIR